MARFRVENPREKQQERQHSRWELFQERFWEWWYHGAPLFPKRNRKPRLKIHSVSHVYSLFLKGDISHEELYLMLTPAQVPKFVDLHQQVKAAMEGEGELPPELVISMSQTFI